MNNDTDWVADVKRWYLAGTATAPFEGDAATAAYGTDVGYEAAHPALQARHWPDAATVTVTTDR